MKCEKKLAHSVPCESPRLRWDSPAALRSSHAGSLTLAPCALACVQAQLPGPMPLASSSQRRVASALRPCMLVCWGTPSCGSMCSPFDGADAAWLVAFAHPMDVATSIESRLLLLLYTLQLDGSLTWAPLAFWYHGCSASTPYPAPSFHLYS